MFWWLLLSGALAGANGTADPSDSDPTELETVEVNADVGSAKPEPIEAPATTADAKPAVAPESGEEGVDEPDADVDDKVEGAPEVEDEPEPQSDEEDDAEVEVEGNTPASNPLILNFEVDLPEAEVVDGLSKDDYRFLKPKRHLLPQNPYSQVDFTAYTLEWGEIKIGLASISFGMLPRTQISTIPLLYALGIFNGRLKVNFLRAGPIDMGIVGNGYYWPMGGFKAWYVGAGPIFSARPVDKFSFHLTGLFHFGEAGGIPSKVPGVLKLLPGADELETWIADAETLIGDGFTAPEFSGMAVDLRMAMDYRFNRRDSIILQVQSLIWTSTTFDFDDQLGLIPLLGLDQALTDNTRVFATYNVTLSWQFSWKQLDWRIGGGWSSIPFAWVLQGNDFSYRMWGKTRISDTKRKKAWRQNRKDVIKPTQKRREEQPPPFEIEAPPDEVAPAGDPQIGPQPEPSATAPTDPDEQPEDNNTTEPDPAPDGATPERP